MLLFLRIAFTVISALCLGALIPVGAILGWTYAILCGLGAFLFFVLMLLCKQAQEQREQPQAGFLDNKENGKNEINEDTEKKS